MQKSLNNQVILVTGAGGGFGQEMTRQFLAAGSHLILADLTTTNLPSDAAFIPGAKGTIIGHIAADLSMSEGSDALWTQAQTLSSEIDILVNNAGLAVFGVISDVPQAHWERLMQVNLLAAMRLTAKALPHMLARRSGHIVNISSVAGLVGTPGLSVYCAAKFGLRGFGEALHADVGRYDVDVTNLYPFFARTPMLNSPQFRQHPSKPLLECMIYEPAVVIAALLHGIQHRKLHVYPGAIPRWIDGLRRLAPWALPALTRRLG